MNNQEAIDILRDGIDKVEWEDYADAIDMAIEALKKQDATEPVNPLSPAWSSMYFCGKCKYPVGKHNNYCSQCGRKVKWNGQSDS